MNTYKDDPRWMTARFDGLAEDGTPVRRGDRIFYYPRTRTVFVGARAESAAADFQACAEDEEFTGSCESEEACRNEERFY